MKSRRPSAPVAVVGTMLLLIFITIPSIILTISHFVLLPIGLFLSVFSGRPSGLRANLIILKLSPIFLILVIPAIFYFYVWIPLCWIFLIWMVIYYTSRRWTGASQQEKQMAEGWKRGDAALRKLNDRIPH